MYSQNSLDRSTGIHARTHTVYYMCMISGVVDVDEKWFSFLLFSIFPFESRHNSSLNKTRPKNSQRKSHPKICGLNSGTKALVYSRWHFSWCFILVCDFVMVTTLYRFNIITGISISIMVFAANHICNNTQKHIVYIHYRTQKKYMIV